MQCTLMLAAQYMLIHLLYFGAQTIYQLVNAGSRRSMDRPLCLDRLKTFETSLNVVEYCPMLCVLALSCHMRAALLTSSHGHPPGWAQDSMVLLAFSVLLQLLLILVE